MYPVAKIDRQQIMKIVTNRIPRVIVSVLFYVVAFTAYAFDSGSTGIDGDLNPTADVQVLLPDNGVLNYKSVNIPAGVTVTFNKNSSNTPVKILVQENAIIAGVLSVDGNDASESQPGVGGPGGYSGGMGATPTSDAQFGEGPGGGQVGDSAGVFNFAACNGWRGIFGNDFGGNDDPGCYGFGFNVAVSYGDKTLNPLLGGSGGGGGGTDINIINARGGHGGGGGGALLLAVSGDLQLTGKLTANGGAGFYDDQADFVSGGGAGSGGALRIVTNLFDGNGTIEAQGGVIGRSFSGGLEHYAAGGGRIRIEAESIKFAGTITPVDLVRAGRPLSIEEISLAQLSIINVAGQNTPVPSDGFSDITILEAPLNPVQVIVEASGIPLDAAVKLQRTNLNSFEETIFEMAPLSGTLTSSTTSANIEITKGSWNLSVYTEFSPTLAQIDVLTKYAKGENIDKIIISSNSLHNHQIVISTKEGEIVPIPNTISKMLKKIGS